MLKSKEVVKDGVSFIIKENWKFFSHDGNKLEVNEKDLENYRSLLLSDDDIKLLVFSYLTKESFYDFNETHGNLRIN